MELPQNEGFVRSEGAQVPRNWRCVRTDRYAPAAPPRKRAQARAHRPIPANCCKGVAGAPDRKGELRPGVRHATPPAPAHRAAAEEGGFRPHSTGWAARGAGSPAALPLADAAVGQHPLRWARVCVIHRREHTRHTWSDTSCSAGTPFEPGASGGQSPFGDTLPLCRGPVGPTHARQALLPSAPTRTIRRQPRALA